MLFLFQMDEIKTEDFEITENNSNCNILTVSGQPVADSCKDNNYEVKPDASEIFTNPWLVQSFDEFLYYCCPECNYKCQQQQDFNSHALMIHPLARQTLQCDEIIPSNNLGIY